jgi:hypothetical protein
MKHLILAFGVLICAAAFVPTEASAVVCAQGVVRAGCAGPRGAVVVRHRPVAVAPVRPAVRCTFINGVRVCR